MRENNDSHPVLAIRSTLAFVAVVSAILFAGCFRNSDRVNIRDLECHADVIRNQIRNGTIIPNLQYGGIFGIIPQNQLPPFRSGPQPNYVEDYGCALYFDFGDHIAADGYMVFESNVVHRIPIPGRPMKTIYRVDNMSKRVDRYVGEY